MENIPKSIIHTALKAQRGEATDYLVYSKLHCATKDKHNKDIIERIARDELAHYNTLRAITGKDVGPQKLRAAFFTLVSRMFGLTFGIKWMENGEKDAQEIYGELKEFVPSIEKIITDEEKHERELASMLKEERLEYIGSVVLGLNDALVELTGTLAGVSMAFQNVSLIALSGLVTGIAAALSMAASQFLSKRAENAADAAKSCLYTGTAYMATVVLLVLPFLVLNNYLIGISITLATAVAIIAVFTFYISVAKDYDFKKRFAEMAGISMGVAGLSFAVGLLVKGALGIDL